MNDIDTMTPEQLRDALAEALGWTCKGAPNDPHREWASYTAIVYAEDERPTLITQNHHPMSPLDSTNALGRIAAMMHRAYRVSIHEVHLDSGDVWQAVAHAFCGSHITAEGPTEAIARARLVLKVLAAAKLGDHDAPGEPHAASHSS